jgi:hypothetical protein
MQIQTVTTTDMARMSDDDIDAAIAHFLGYQTKVESGELWVKLPCRTSKLLVASSDWWPSFWCWARSWDQASSLYQEMPREMWDNRSPYTLSSREMCERWLRWKMTGTRTGREQ